jgi:NADPH2:quinone reductase
MQKNNTEAFLLKEKGNPEKAFSLSTISIETPKSDEVLIEVTSFGLNYADVMARNGLYKEAPPMPCVIGYEVVGTVTKVGRDVEKSWIGKRVVAFTRFGGYSKKVTTKVSAITEIDDLDAATALSLCTQSVTAFYMANYVAPIHRNEIVLIHAAAGGVGSILIQLAKKAGATVIAKIGNESKHELVKKLGADCIINYNQSNYISEVEKYLNGKKLDVIYNPVGGETFKNDMKILNPGGKMFLFGGSALSKGKWGILSSLNFVRKMGLMIPIGLMMQSKSVLGINMLKIADEKPEVIQECLNAVISLYREKVIEPQIGGEFDTSELAKAHALLESGNTVGKLAIHW